MLAIVMFVLGMCFDNYWIAGAGVSWALHRWALREFKRDLARTALHPHYTPVRD